MAKIKHKDKRKYKNNNLRGRLFNGGLTDRMNQSWNSSSYSSDQIIHSQLNILRNRSREQLRNNDYICRLVQLLQNNIIGAKGFKMRSQITQANGKSDRAARAKIEASWQGFVDDSDLLTLQNLVISGLVTDGEVFIFLRVDEAGELRPTLIDPSRIDTDYNVTNRANPIIMGIEYNQCLEPIAYHVNDAAQKHPAISDSVASEKTRIEAAHVIHIFKPSFVGQKRGIPWIAPSLNRLFQLGKFEEAALVAARIGAAKMGFFYNENEQEYTGDDGESMSFTAEAGTFENIGSMKFQAFDPQYPNGEFKVFSEQILKGISSGWGVDYHTIGNDLSGVNYSSARVGMLETREYYKALQTWLAAKLLKPIFKAWLKLALFTNKLDANGKPASYLEPCLFVGRRWEWVDPNKEANAKKTLYEMKVISLSQIIRERGDDPIDVFDEIAEENRLLKERGLNGSDVLEFIN